MNFTYSAPTKVFFGKIEYSNLCSELSHYGNNVLVVTGGVSTCSIAKKVCDGIQKNSSKINIQIISGITSNPRASYIEQSAHSAAVPDVILSIGGGSVHDAAKVLAVLLTHPGITQQYTTDGEYSVPGITDKTLPVITIPTVSGTGSEVSPAALVRIDSKKKVVFSPYLYPKTTFINPLYATSVPKQTFINTALDALVQGIESYVSTNAQDFSKRFSISAIERILKYLPSIKEENISTELYEQCALASIESLYAVGQSTVGAVHAISDPLSGIFDLHHGEAVGFLLPYVVAENYAAASKQYNRIHVLFNNILDIKGQTLQDSIFEFYNIIGFDCGLIAEKLIRVGIKDKVSACVNDSFNGDMEGNPQLMDVTLVEKILKNSIGM